MKMILYIDLISPAGHDNFDMNMIRLMKNNFEVDVMVRSEMIARISENANQRVKPCPDEIFPDSRANKSRIRLGHALKWRWSQYKFVKYILEEQAGSYDFVFFSSVDIFTFGLATMNIKRRNFAFVDHGIYRLNNRLTKFFYCKLLANDIKIIALEEYIAQYMRENGICNPMSVIHHPVPINTKKDFVELEGKSHYMIFAPSTSNEEGFIKELMDKRDHIPNRVSIVIKSHGIEFKSDNLRIFQNRIEQKEYEQMFADADFILVPYESSYNYRTSAILFESLSKGKRVLLWGNNTLKNYFRDYPQSVCVFSDVDELLSMITNLENVKFDINQINDFMNHYSDEFISEQIKEAFS